MKVLPDQTITLPQTLVVELSSEIDIIFDAEDAPGLTSSLDAFRAGCAVLEKAEVGVPDVARQEPNHFWGH